MHGCKPVSTRDQSLLRCPALPINYINNGEKNGRHSRSYKKAFSKSHERKMPRLLRRTGIRSQHVPNHNLPIMALPHGQEPFSQTHHDKPTEKGGNTTIKRRSITRLALVYYVLGDTTYQLYIGFSYHMLCHST